MKKIMIICVFLMVAVNAFAQVPTTASIDELLRVTKTDQIMETVMEPMEQTMKQAIAASLQGKPVPAEQRQAIERFVPNMMQIIRSEFTYANLRPLYVQIYQESFTQEEIDGLVDFYKSAAGQAFTNKMPVVMQKSMSIMQTKLQPMMQRMQVGMQKVLEDAKLAK
jgi:uncharacterized protein